MKLITFLGTGNYQETNYFWEKDASKKLEYKTKFFSEAVISWLKPEKILIVLTETVQKHNNWTELKNLLETKFEGQSIEPINIPNGSSENELWDIFSNLTESINQNDEVAFDITHSFRSLPVLSLLAISYLRVAKNIKIKYLLYGAFEAKNEANQVPTFDLTPFITLLDWVTATDKSLKFGDSRELASLLQSPYSILREKAKTLSPPPPSEYYKNLPQSLSKLGVTLDELSKNLLLARPIEISKSVGKFNTELIKAESQAYQFAKPFVLLLDHVREEYKSFERTDLTTQLQLIEWYIDHNHISQAVSLGREWLISWACEALGLKPWNDYLAPEYRVHIEKEITAYSHWKREKKKKEKEGKPFIKPILMIEHINNIDKNDTFYIAWEKIDLRNDLMHCGMRPDPLKVESILQQAKDFVILLRKCNSDL